MNGKTLVLISTCLLYSTSYAQVDNRINEIAKRSSPTGRLEIKDAINVEPDSLFLKYKDQFGLSSADDMRRFKTVAGESGREHQRYQQYHNGLEVEGSVYVLHSQNGRTTRANGKMVSSLSLNTVPKLSYSASYDVAKKWMDSLNLSLVSKTEENENGGRLLITRKDNGKPLSMENVVLAYLYFGYKDSQFYPYALYADANSGEFIKSIPMFTACFSINDCENDPCSSVTDECSTNLYGDRDINSIYDSGLSKYKLYDDCRGVGIHTLEYVSPASVEVLSNTSDFSSILNTTQAHWVAMKTFDYFCEKFDVKLMEGSGYEIQQLINWISSYSSYYEKNVFTHYPTRVLIAQQNLGGPVYCSLQVSIDIIAHEWTHAITDYSSDLHNADGEAAALNEGFSDIFGKMVEYYIDKEDDPYHVWNKFVMGEEVCLSTSPVRRSFSNPTATNLADVYGGTEWQSGDKYVQSGVLLRWFYLLAMGGSGTNSHPVCPYTFSVSGITPEKAELIAFRTLTSELTPTDGYMEAREGSIAVASDAYGSTSSELAAVIEAWNAVGVYDNNYVVACGDYYGTDEVKAVYQLETCKSTSGSSNVIHSGADIEYKAGERVVLKPGFVANSGSYFRASIESCAGQFGKGHITGRSVDPVKNGSSNNSETISLVLHSIAPNPTTGITELQYTISEPCDVEVSLMSCHGLAEIVQSHRGQTSGIHTIVIDVSSLPTGLYYCVLRAGTNVSRKTIAKLP